MKQHRQVSEQAEELEGTVIGGNLSAAVEQHLAVAVPLAGNGDDPLAPFLVVEQAGPGLPWTGQLPYHLPGRSEDHHGRGGPRQGQGSHLAAGPEQGIDGDDRGPSHQVEAAEEAEGALGAEERDQQKAGGEGAGERPQAVGGVDVSDAAADLPEASGPDAADHRKGSAHQQGRNQHDAEGHGESRPGNPTRSSPP